MSEFRINDPDSRQEKRVTWSANDTPIQISGAVRGHHRRWRGDNSQSTHQRNTNQRHNEPYMVPYGVTTGRRRGKAFRPAQDKVVHYFDSDAVVATINSSAPPYWTKGVAQLGHMRNLNLDREVPKGEFLSNAWIHRAQARCRCVDIAGALKGFHCSILGQSQLLQSE